MAGGCTVEAIQDEPQDNVQSLEPEDMEDLELLNVQYEVKQECPSVTEDEGSIKLEDEDDNHDRYTDIFDYGYITDEDGHCGVWPHEQMKGECPVQRRAS